MSETPFDLDARETRQASKAKDAEQRALQAKNDLLTVLSSEGGRRFVYRQLEQAGLYRSSYVNGDPNGTAFNEGMRNSGLRLLGEIVLHAPEQYFVMLKENTSANS